MHEAWLYLDESQTAFPAAIANESPSGPMLFVPFKPFLLAAAVFLDPDGSPRRGKALDRSLLRMVQRVEWQAGLSGRGGSGQLAARSIGRFVCENSAREQSLSVRQAG